MIRRTRKKAGRKSAVGRVKKTATRKTAAGVAKKTTTRKPASGVAKKGVTRKPAGTARKTAGRKTAARAAKRDATFVPAPRAAISPEVIREAVRSKRFLAADRTALDVAEIATWDPYLLREHRLLVPIDVQALYVPPDGREPMVRLPMLVAGAGGVTVDDPEDGLPDPFDAGTPRPAGVHLHWAMPDALLRGTFAQRADGAANRLALPALPDRFVVLRIALPQGAKEPVVSGWVLEADRAVAVPMTQWAEGNAASSAATPAGATITPTELTGTVGGAITWAGAYDAVLNRFSFHDPLADIAALAPQGVDGDSVAYVVAGWWSDAALDPLDKARSNDSLHELLDRMRWRLLYEWGDETAAWKQQEAQDQLRRSLGLESEPRWSATRPVKVSARAPAGATPFVPVDKGFVIEQDVRSASVFATDAAKRFTAPPWQLRSTLLHGAVYGVPVRGAVTADRRPDPDQLSVALGLHDDDLIAGFAAATGTADQRRAAERLLAAFTSQKVSRLGSADGLVELEEHEHAVAFASLPSGSAGTDRFLQRVQTGGTGGLDVGRKRAADVVGLAVERAALSRGSTARAAARALESELLFAIKGKPELVKASTAVINDLAR